MSLLPLRGQRRRVRERAAAAQREAQALHAARRELAERIKSRIARPSVLLALFAVGLGYGWVRGSERQSAKGTEARTARLSRLAAAFIAGARLFGRARRADQALGRLL